MRSDDRLNPWMSRGVVLMAFALLCYGLSISWAWAQHAMALWR